MFDRFRRFHPLSLFGAGVAGGTLATLIARNFISVEKKISHQIAHAYGVSDPQFERALGQLLGPAIIAGNRVTAFQNGDEIFPAMLHAIRGAKRSVTFESFIYWKGHVAEQFTTALAERARAGVKVHVLLDGLGCNCVNGALIRQMRQAGAEVEIYNIVQLYDIDRVNNRTHRKLLVVDGRIGFTGGVGIGDNWSGHAQSPRHWRDSHYRVEGPVTAQMQSAFVDNWMKTRAAVLHDDCYFPALEDAGSQRCQVFKSAPHEGSDSARLMFLFSIACARESIQLSNAYFVPDNLTLQTLVEACERGVAVQILLPGPHADKAFVRDASRHRWGRLLRAGARFFEYQPTMLHCKLLIVDNIWTSVGSANFDNRSFRLNDEVNLNILDTSFATAQAETFENDKLNSREVTLADWLARPLIQQVADGTANLFRSQL